MATAQSTHFSKDLENILSKVNADTSNPTRKKFCSRSDETFYSFNAISVDSDSDYDENDFNSMSYNIPGDRNQEMSGDTRRNNQYFVNSMKKGPLLEATDNSLTFVPMDTETAHYTVRDIKLELGLGNKYEQQRSSSSITSNSNGDHFEDNYTSRTGQKENINLKYCVNNEDSIGKNNSSHTSSRNGESNNNVLLIRSPVNQNKVYSLDDYNAAIAGDFYMEEDGLVGHHIATVTDRGDYDIYPISRYAGVSDLTEQQRRHLEAGEEEEEGEEDEMYDNITDILNRTLETITEESDNGGDATDNDNGSSVNDHSYKSNKAEPRSDCNSLVTTPSTKSIVSITEFSGNSVIMDNQHSENGDFRFGEVNQQQWEHQLHSGYCESEVLSEVDDGCTEGEGDLTLTESSCNDVNDNVQVSPLFNSVGLKNNNNFVMERYPMDKDAGNSDSVVDIDNKTASSSSSTLKSSGTDIANEETFNNAGILNSETTDMEENPKNPTSVPEVPDVESTSNMENSRKWYEDDFQLKDNRSVSEESYYSAKSSLDGDEEDRSTPVPEDEPDSNPHPLLLTDKSDFLFSRENKPVDWDTADLNSEIAESEVLSDFVSDSESMATYSRNASVVSDYPDAIEALTAHLRTNQSSNHQRQSKEADVIGKQAVNSSRSSSRNGSIRKSSDCSITSATMASDNTGNDLNNAAAKQHKHQNVSSQAAENRSALENNVPSEKTDTTKYDHFNPVFSTSQQSFASQNSSVHSHSVKHYDSYLQKVNEPSNSSRNSSNSFSSQSTTKSSERRSSNTESNVMGEELFNNSNKTDLSATEGSSASGSTITVPDIDALPRINISDPQECVVSMPQQAQTVSSTSQASTFSATSLDGKANSNDKNAISPIEPAETKKRLDAEMSFPRNSNPQSGKLIHISQDLKRPKLFSDSDIPVETSTPKLNPVNFTFSVNQREVEVVKIEQTKCYGPKPRDPSPTTVTYRSKVSSRSKSPVYDARTRKVITSDKLYEKVDRNSQVEHQSKIDFPKFQRPSVEISNTKEVSPVSSVSSDTQIVEQQPLVKAVIGRESSRGCPEDSFMSSVPNSTNNSMGRTMSSSNKDSVNEKGSIEIASPVFQNNDHKMPVMYANRLPEREHHHNSEANAGWNCGPESSYPGKMSHQSQVNSNEAIKQKEQPHIFPNKVDHSLPATNAVSHPISDFGKQEKAPEVSTKREYSSYMYYPQMNTPSVQPNIQPVHSDFSTVSSNKKILTTQTNKSSDESDYVEPISIFSMTTNTRYNKEIVNSKPLVPQRNKTFTDDRKDEIVTNIIEQGRLEDENQQIMRSSHNYENVYTEEFQLKPKTCTAVATSTALARKDIKVTPSEQSEKLGDSVVSAVASAEATGESPYIAVARATARAATIATASAAKNASKETDQRDVTVMISTSCTIKDGEGNEITNDSNDVIKALKNEANVSVYKRTTPVVDSSRRRESIDNKNKGENTTGKLVKVSINEGTGKQVKTIEIELPEGKGDITQLITDSVNKLLQTSQANSDQSNNISINDDRNKQNFSDNIDGEVSGGLSSELKMDKNYRNNNNGNALKDEGYQSSNSVRNRGEDSCSSYSDRDGNNAVVYDTGKMNSAVSQHDEKVLLKQTDNAVVSSNNNTVHKMSRTAPQSASTGGRNVNICNGSGRMESGSIKLRGVVNNSIDTGNKIATSARRGNHGEITQESDFKRVKVDNDAIPEVAGVKTGCYNVRSAAIETGRNRNYYPENQSIGIDSENQRLLYKGIDRYEKHNSYSSVKTERSDSSNVISNNNNNESTILNMPPYDNQHTEGPLKNRYDNNTNSERLLKSAVNGGANTVELLSGNRSSVTLPRPYVQSENRLKINEARERFLNNEGDDNYQGSNKNNTGSGDNANNEVVVLAGEKVNSQQLLGNNNKLTEQEEQNSIKSDTSSVKEKGKKKKKKKKEKKTSKKDKETSSKSKSPADKKKNKVEEVVIDNKVNKKMSDNKKNKTNTKTQEETKQQVPKMAQPVYSDNTRDWSHKNSNMWRNSEPVNTSNSNTALRGTSKYDAVLSTGVGVNSGSNPTPYDVQHIYSDKDNDSSNSYSIKRTSSGTIPKEFFFHGGSRTSLIETDLDTGISTERPLVYETDLDQLQHGNRSKSVGNLLHKTSDKTNYSNSTDNDNNAENMQRYGSAVTKDSFERTQSMTYLSKQQQQLGQNQNRFGGEQFSSSHQNHQPSENEQRVNKSLSKLHLPQWFNNSSGQNSNYQHRNQSPQRPIELQNTHKDITSTYGDRNYKVTSPVAHPDGVSAMIVKTKPVVIQHRVNTPSSMISGSRAGSQGPVSMQQNNQGDFKLPSSKWKNQSHSFKPIPIKALHDVGWMQVQRPAKEAYLRLKAEQETKQNQGVYVPPGGFNFNSISGDQHQMNNLQVSNTTPMVSYGQTSNSFAYQSQPPIDVSTISKDPNMGTTHSYVNIDNPDEEPPPPLPPRGIPPPLPPRRQSSNEALRLSPGSSTKKTHSETSSSPDVLFDSAYDSLSKGQTDDSYISSTSNQFSSGYKVSENNTTNTSTGRSDLVCSDVDDTEFPRGVVVDSGNLHKFDSPLRDSAYEDKVPYTTTMTMDTNNRSFYASDKNTTNMDIVEPLVEKAKSSANWRVAQFGSDLENDLELLQYPNSPGSRKGLRGNLNSSTSSSGQVHPQGTPTVVSQPNGSYLGIPNQDQTDKDSSIDISKGNTTFEDMLDGLLGIPSLNSSMMDTSRASFRKSSSGAEASSPSTIKPETPLETVFRLLEISNSQQNPDISRDSDHSFPNTTMLSAGGQSPKFPQISESSKDTLESSVNFECGNFDGSASSVLVKCRNPKCKKQVTLEEAKLTYKTCHNCYTYYCSRDCRKVHWERHKKKCIFSRVNSHCKHVIKKINGDTSLNEEVSKSARTGYIQKGRGSVVISFSSVEKADKFLKDGLPALEHPLAYISVPEIEESQLFGEQAFELLDLCRTYNPEVKYVVEVIILGCKQLPLTQPAPRHQGPAIKKCSKIRLAGVKKQNKTASGNKTTQKQKPETVGKISIVDKLNDNDTLILTAVPGAEITENMEERKAREICFTNIQSKLRDRGISLRHQYPDVYTKLCMYVSEKKEFAPITLFPTDRHTGKSFMCLIMPNSEPDVEWKKNPGLMEELGFH